jgi:hypothetical protein
VKNFAAGSESPGHAGHTESRAGEVNKLSAALVFADEKELDMR